MKRKATIELEELKFTMELPATVKDGRPFFAAEDLHEFEKRVAAWVIENRRASPRGLWALRAGAGLSLTGLSELLHVSRETISRWERGVSAFDLVVWHTLADLARDAIRGRGDTAAELRQASAYKPASKAREISI
jgi:hypothetical protein